MPKPAGPLYLWAVGVCVSLCVYLCVRGTVFVMCRPHGKPQTNMIRQHADCCQQKQQQVVTCRMNMAYICTHTPTPTHTPRMWYSSTPMHAYIFTGRVTHANTKRLETEKALHSFVRPQKVLKLRLQPHAATVCGCICIGIKHKLNIRNANVYI